MGNPTAAQRRALAKSGYAMPDGSYYIRLGQVGASDLQNAIEAVGRGEAAGDSGDSIRKHIMDRAKALGLSAKIPETWNTDGSLKHHGVKGMHWGVRKAGESGDSGGSVKPSKPSKADKLNDKAKQHELISAAHTAGALHAEKELDELESKGPNSAAFKRVYGPNAANMSNREFYLRFGESKSSALNETANNLRILHNQYASSANRHSAKAVKLHTKAANLNHSDTSENSDSTGEDLQDLIPEGLPDNPKTRRLTAPSLIQVGSCYMNGIKNPN